MRGPAATQATVFPSPQKPTFPNSNSIWNQVDEEPLCGCATSKSIFIYLVDCTTVCWQKLPYSVLIEGFWYFAEKKAKFRGIFRGKFAEKSANFTEFLWEKSQNSWKIGWFCEIFAGEKSKIRRKVGRFLGILAEKNQISKDFQGQILRKIGRFHGKFRGEASPRNNQ